MPPIAWPCNVSGLMAPAASEDDIPTILDRWAKLIR
jgi:hypothetical protein